MVSCAPGQPGASGGGTREIGVREEVVGRRHADRSRRGVASSRRESARKRVEREFLLGTMMQWVLSALTQLQQPAALQTGLRLVNIVVSVWSSRADRVEVGLEEDDTVRIGVACRGWFCWGCGT